MLYPASPVPDPWGSWKESSHPSPPAVSSSQAPARLDITGLDQTVQQLLSVGIAPATRRNYSAGERRYLGFCQQYHFSCPFPVSKLVLMAFVAFLYQEKLSASTVNNYLAAVRFAQIALGLGDPRMGEMPRLESGTHATNNTEDLKVVVAGLPKQESGYNVLLWFPQVWGSGGAK